MKTTFTLFFSAFVLVILQGCGMNGTMIEPSRGPVGKSKFTINNLYPHDIVVKVCNIQNLDEAVHYIYVSSGNSATIKGVSPGNYVIRYSMGDEWDNSTKGFTLNRENFETDQKFEFTETEVTEETSRGKRINKTYSTQSFTLGSSDGLGNVSTSKIEDEEFGK